MSRAIDRVEDSLKCLLWDAGTVVGDADDQFSAIVNEVRSDGKTSFTVK